MLSRQSRLPPDIQTFLLRLLWALILAAIACYVTSSPAFSQTVVAVTGHMGDASGQPVSGLDLQFQLANCGGNQPRVVGHFGIIKSVVDLIPDSTTGVVSGDIWPNDVIDCGGTTGGTFYYLTPILNNVPQAPPACYQITSAQNPFNLDTATPCDAIPGPPSPTPPVDATYNNLSAIGFFSGTAGRFTGQLEVGSLLLDAAPSPCPSGQFTTALSDTLTLTCSTPSYPAPPVTSVFGRTGGVLAQTGDYTCSQVTGCPTGAITGLSGAVLASGPGVATASLSATGVTAGHYTSADFDIGADGRITSAANGGIPSRVCVSAGCSLTLPDGTILQWGSVAAPTSGGTLVNVAITFPIAFTATPTLTVSGASQPDGGDDAYVVYSKALSTTGATAVVRCSVNIGGSGCPSLSTSVPVKWLAIGF